MLAIPPGSVPLPMCYSLSRNRFFAASEALSAGIARHPINKAMASSSARCPFSTPNCNNRQQRRQSQGTIVKEHADAPYVRS